MQAPLAAAGSAPPPARGPTAVSPLAPRHNFVSVLRAQSAGPGAMSPREAAEELVASAFIEPVLAQLRESNDAAPPFAPGDAERRFGPLLDAEIARRIVRSEGYGLVDAVARRLQERTTTRPVNPDTAPRSQPDARVDASA